MNIFVQSIHIYLKKGVSSVHRYKNTKINDFVNRFISQKCNCASCQCDGTDDKETLGNNLITVHAKSHMFLFNSTAKATCFLCDMYKAKATCFFFWTTWQKSGVLVLTPRPWPCASFVLHDQSHVFLVELHGHMPRFSCCATWQWPRVSYCIPQYPGNSAWT